MLPTTERGGGGEGEGKEWVLNAEMVVFQLIFFPKKFLWKKFLWYFHALPFSLFKVFFFNSNLCCFHFSFSAGLSVSGVGPRQITFNFPASPRSVTYYVDRVFPDGRLQVVGYYPSSTNPTQQTFNVEPGTSYRFVVGALDPSIWRSLWVSNPVSVNVPSGKWQCIE